MSIFVLYEFFAQTAINYRRIGWSRPRSLRIRSPSLPQLFPECCCHCWRQRGCRLSASFFSVPNWSDCIRTVQKSLHLDERKPLESRFFSVEIYIDVSSRARFITCPPLTLSVTFLSLFSFLWHICSRNLLRGIYLHITRAKFPPPTAALNPWPLQ